MLALQCILQAQEILEQVAKQVQPILRRRQFKVPLLTEFYPQPRLLVWSAVGAWPAPVAVVT